MSKSGSFVTAVMVGIVMLIATIWGYESGKVLGEKEATRLNPPPGYVLAWKPKSGLVYRVGETAFSLEQATGLAKELNESLPELSHIVVRRSDGGVVVNVEQEPEPRWDSYTYNRALEAEIERQQGIMERRKMEGTGHGS